ncbi:MAG: hypothetical protein AAGU11_19140, partial [Syntrophobacteraceae bacterium]
EDQGKYDRLFEEQKRECMKYLQERGIDKTSPVVFYKSRGELFTDIERDRIARLVVFEKARLSVIPDEIDAILYELTMRCVELLAVKD